MILPGGIPLKVYAYGIAVAFLLWSGWFARGVWQDHLDKQAQDEALEQHAADVVTDETSTLLFATTLANINTTTTNSLLEIPHANLKPVAPRIIIKEVPVPGEVLECPVVTQFTPDFIRLWNDEPSEATTGFADRGLSPVPTPATVAERVPTTTP